MKYYLLNINKNPKSIFNFIFLLIIALLINCLGSIIATNILFPLYLDSLLTIGITAIFGLFPGILCAFFSNFILYFFDYTMLPFVTCHILTSFLAWLVFVKNYNNKNFSKFSIDSFLWAGLWSAISNSILGNIIADLLLGTLVNRSNVILPVQGIYVVTHDLVFSTYLSGTLTNLVDKFISAVLSFFFYTLYTKRK